MLPEDDELAPHSRRRRGAEAVRSDVAADQHRLLEGREAEAEEI